VHSNLPGWCCVACHTPRAGTELAPGSGVAYTSRMADPPPRPDPPPSAGARDDERFGPLLVRRSDKDDGRALILYRAPSPSEGDSG
jgi:hypothetical protein